MTLVSLRKNITATDRAECKYSRPTIDLYLSGKGPDLDTAVDMLVYFNGKIEERRQKIVNIS